MADSGRRSTATGGGARRMRLATTAAALVLGASAAGAQVTGPGLAGPEGHATAWPALHWRLMPGADLALAATTPGGDPVRGLLGTAVVADVYVSSSGLGPRVAGGLRATSGLVARPASAGLQPGRGASGSDGLAGPLPYLGVGYSGLHLPTGWGVTADLGLVAATPGAARLGRASFGSGPAFEDVVRDLRLTPVLRLGVSYAF